MKEFLSKLIEKFWLKYKSLPIVFLFLATVCVPFVPKAEDDSFIQLKLVIMICLSVFVIYFCLCVSNNRLPHAKKGTCAVLFVVDAETEVFFNDIKNKLICNFDEYINFNSHFSFSPVYIRKTDIPDYSLNNKDSMLRLLTKTGTMFVVDVKYRVDDVTHAEKYEIGFNFGVIHPTFADSITSVLKNDMHLLQKRVRKKRFERSHLLEQFDVTAQQLSLICKYIVGFVMLLSQQPQAAYELLREVYVLAKEMRTSVDDPLLKLVELRLVSACLINAELDIDRFSQTKELRFLDHMDQMVEEANFLRPGLPQYYTCKAYYEIAKNRDAKAAAEYVSKAKCIDSSKSWRYSDAFLAAFTGKSPLTIYKKYMYAFKVDYNLIQIVDYIEYIISEEPERTGLFLAAGLVYEEMGDRELSNCYFKKYLDANTNSTIQDLLEEKMAQSA